MGAVSIAETPAVCYRSRAASVTLAELDAFLQESIAELTDSYAIGPAFAIFHGPVNDSTRSTVEVGVAAVDGDRVLEGGCVVRARTTGDTGYEAIHRVYDAIAGFIAANALRQRGPTREAYLGGERFSEEIEVVWPVEAPERA